MTRGVFLFCHDNGAFEYHKLVPICAWYVKHHLNVPICVAADELTMERIRALPHIDRLIDTFLVTDIPISNGSRIYRSRSGDAVDTTRGPFLNKSRHTVYQLTPYDETLVIDLDYIVMNDKLNSVWGSDAPIRINNRTTGLTPDTTMGAVTHIHPLGIPLYWATVVYFKKSREAELFFQGVEYVRDNYEYFSTVYRFNNAMYRNDYSMSIVVHAQNGGVGENGLQWPVQSLPDPVLMFAWDHQPLLQIDATRAWMVAYSHSDLKLRSPAYTQGQSVHFIHKQSLLNVAGPWVAEQMESEYV